MAPTVTFDVSPAQQRGLRACMVCSVVMLQSQFFRIGCPNCDDFLKLQGSQDNIQECTSPSWEGLITLVDSSKSWVARWQRLEGYVTGTYAVKVTGVLPDEVIQNVRDAGVKYIARDGSEQDDEQLMDD